MRVDRERLLDIKDAIERIEKYAARGRDVFERDELIQTWIVHNLEMIGEAFRSFSPQFREKHPELPWSQIIGMRNILIHRYFGVDTKVIWSFVEKDMPELKRKIEMSLREDKAGG